MIFLRRFLVCIFICNTIILSTDLPQGQSHVDSSTQQTSQMPPRYNGLNEPTTKATLYGFAAFAIIALTSIYLISRWTPSDNADEYGPL